MNEMARKRTSKIMIVLLSLVVTFTFTFTMSDNAEAAGTKKFTLKYDSKMVVLQTTKKNGYYKLVTFKTLQKKLGKFKRYKQYDFGKGKRGYRYKKKGIDIKVCNNKERRSIGPFYFTITTKKAIVAGIQVGMPAKKAKKIWKKAFRWSNSYKGGFSGFTGAIKYRFYTKKGKVKKIEFNGS